MQVQYQYPQKTTVNITQTETGKVRGKDFVGCNKSPRQKDSSSYKQEDNYY